MATEFMDIPRSNPRYRSGRERDFRDVEIRLGPEGARRQASRCMGCGVPFCHGYGCPLSNAIPDAMAAVAEGRMRDAYEIFRATSPFPEFTSRVCPALCESACCAGISFSPVTVKQVEYEVAEAAFENGWAVPAGRAPRTGRRVAVIGSGPAGLAAAGALNRSGHEVVVFEKAASAGGLLRYGIPDFKLEKRVVDRRIGLLCAEGVMFEYGVEVGRDVSAAYLMRKFDAVCLCTGCPVPRDLAVPGRNLEGIFFALEFLAGQNRAISGELDGVPVSAKGKKVLVIGGGDTGSDCVGTAIRQGAKSVVQIEIMPEPPEGRHPSTPWPMWEYKKRTSSSHLEGGTRMWGVVAKSFGGARGRVKSLKAGLADWEFSPEGRPSKFSERPGGDFEIDADLVLISMGFTGAERGPMAGELGLDFSERGTFASLRPSKAFPGVFAAGDCVGGPSLVVRAAASGLAAAASVSEYLKSVPQHNNLKK